MADARTRSSGNRLAVMAWRNLWRNRRRTLLTLSSIVFGVFLAVLMMAMQDRNWADMIDLSARLGGGHVTVQHAEHQEMPTLDRSLGGVGALAARIAEREDVRRVVPRIAGHAMLSTATESAGAGFLAFDPALEDETTLAVLEGLAEGEMLADSSAPRAVLGAGLADLLGAELGDRMVFTLTDKGGEITGGLARVGGIVRTGSPAVDDGLVLLPIGLVRSVVGYGEDEATQLAVFLDDQRRAQAVADTLDAAMETGVVALSWAEASPELAGFIAAKVGGALFMQGLIGILVAAGIFNTMFVSVMERLREFGVMVAIGWSPGKLFRLVLCESAWMGLVGLAAAAVVTIGPYEYLASRGLDLSMLIDADAMDIAGIGLSTTLKVGIFPEHVVAIALLTFAAVMLSGVYPAWKAGRVEPVDTLTLV